MDIDQKRKLISFLSAYTISNKQEKMAAILKERTRHITIVLEDIFQPHNASAILRSAECFGIQTIHLVERRNTFTATGGVALGAAKWLDLNYHASIDSCFDSLKADGYKIVATTLHPDAQPLPQLPLDNKLALVFGTEHTGLSPQALAHADLFVTIPMCGFTQSLNVSVSAALCLYTLTERLKQSSIAWQLSEQEHIDLTLAWMRRTVKGAAALEKQYVVNKP